MKKNIFSNRSKTKYKRMMARYLIVMLLGLPIVANLNEYAFADDLVAFDPGVEYTEDVQDADVDVTEYEALDEADTEVFELAGVEDMAEESPERMDVSEECVEFSDEDIEQTEESVAGETTGRPYEDMEMSTLNYKGWNAYAGLKFGDKVTAVPGTNDLFLVNDINCFGGYDKDNNCWYGVARIPAYDYDRFNEYEYALHNTSKVGSAIVRIDGIENVELDKEYEATYLYDCSLYFNNCRKDTPYTVQYKDGRIYTLAEVYCEDLRDAEQLVNVKYEGYLYQNACTFYLLYSTDTSGDDIRLHYRFADVRYDKTRRTPWYANLDSIQHIVENGVDYHYAYRGIVWRNSKWYGVFVKYIPASHTDGYIPPVYIDTFYEPLPNDIISDEDLGGFLSVSDKWFDKRNAIGEYSLDDVPRTIFGIKNRECIDYTRQWLYDNGFKKTAYIEKMPATFQDSCTYTNIWFPDYLKKYGEPYGETPDTTHTDDDITYAYSNGVIKKGGEVVEPGKKDDPSGDITEDDIPMPKTIEYNLGPIVVKNQLDIKQLVSANSATKMKYKVDNRKIAKVNNKGIMTGKNAGYVTVTGYAKVRNSSNKKKWVWKETGSVKVEITRPSFKGLGGGILTMKFKGGTLNLNDYITNDSTMTPTFSVNRSGMVKVSNDGTIEATGEGKAKVTVMFGKYKMKLKVLVTP